MTIYTGQEIVGVFLSGGADNFKPSDCLGGGISAHRLLGLYPIMGNAIPGLVIEDVNPECGEGAASIFISGGEATFTPPDGLAGTAIPVAEGESKFLRGQDHTKGIWINRIAGEEFQGTCTFTLVDQFGGAFSMSDIPSADRAAGLVTYRAVFLTRLGELGRIFMWMTTDGQSSFALASEEPESDGSIQTISDDETAPSGLSWVNAVSEGTALEVASLGEDASIGVWIRRTFPAAGVVSADEQVNFHLKFEEGG